MSQVSGVMVTASLQIGLLWNWIRKGLGILTLGNDSLYEIPSEYFVPGPGNKPSSGVLYEAWTVSEGLVVVVFSD